MNIETRHTFQTKSLWEKSVLRTAIIFTGFEYDPEGDGLEYVHDGDNTYVWCTLEQVDVISERWSYLLRELTPPKDIT